MVVKIVLPNSPTLWDESSLLQILETGLETHQAAHLYLDVLGGRIEKLDIDTGLHIEVAIGSHDTGLYIASRRRPSRAPAVAIG